MSSKKQPSDAKILARLRRSSNARTAAELGTTAARLRTIEGVVEAGRVSTGKAGRPAVLFTVEERLSEVGALPPTSDDISQAARSGELSERVVND